MKEKQTLGKKILSVFMAIVSIAWMYPILMILFNSLKIERAISTTTVFEIPTAETFNGLKNFKEAIFAQGFANAFMASVLITASSLVLILICCSMCAWYITRVDSILSKIVYYLFVFSMVVPFQMLKYCCCRNCSFLF